MLLKTVLSKFVSQSPDRIVQATVRTADDARDRKDWQAAATLYAEALRADPNRHDLRVQLGNMLKESGRLEEAEQAYLAALDRTPDDADLHLQLGHLRKLQGNPAQALQHYDRARTLQPDNADAQAEYRTLAQARAAEEPPRPDPVITATENAAPPPQAAIGGINSVQSLDIGLLSRPVVTFDLFDTLLRRRYIAVNEVHDTVSAFVLAQMGRFASDTPGAMTLGRYRTTDYLKASPHGANEEPSLTQLWTQLIGAHIPDSNRAELLAARAAAFEFDLDLRNLAAVPGAADLLARLKAAGKTIVAVSDMYFSKVQIEAILDRVGLLTYFDHVFVSCDAKLTKQTGRLFEHVLRTLDLVPADVVHIGDNPRSDVEIPRRIGIQALHIDQPELLKLERPCYGRRPDIFQEIGDLTKLFIFQMSLFACSDAIDKIFFLSRDGCLLNRFIGAWESPLLGHFVEAPPRDDLWLSRATCCWLELDFNGEWLAQSIGHAFWLRHGRATARQLSDILGIAETPAELGAATYEARTDTDFVVSAYRDSGLASAIRTSLAKKRSDVERYLTGVGFFDHRRVMVCDVGYSGTVIRNLNSFFLQESSRPDAPRPPHINLHVLASRFNYFDNGLAAIPYARFCDRVILPHDALPTSLNDNFAWLEYFFKHPTKGPLLGYTDVGGIVQPNHTTLADPGPDHPSAKVLNYARPEDADLALLWMAAVQFWDQLSGPLIERFSNPDESTVNQMLDEIYEADAVSGKTRSIVMIGDGLTDDEIYRVAKSQDYWIPGSIRATAHARQNATLPAAPVDCAFYRAFYDDLAGLSDAALATHYAQHGRREGRFRSRDHMLSVMSDVFGPLPDGFHYASYLWANPDLVPHDPPRFHAELHYIKTGRSEGRPYYRPVPSLDRAFADLIHRQSIVLMPDEAAAAADGMPFSAIICKRLGLEAGPWLTMLEWREFVALNAQWCGRLTSSAAAVQAFLREGVARLAPLSLKSRFDPVYYRATVPAASALSDPDAYRQWLTDGCLLGRSPSEAHRLDELIGVTDFPPAFDAEAFWQRHHDLPAQQRSRTDALAAFLRVGTLADVAAVHGPGDELLWEALGRSSVDHGRFDVADAAYRKAIAKGGPGGRLWHQIGDLALRKQEFGAALDAYRTGLTCEAPSRWSFINAVQAACSLHAFDTALAILQAGQAAWKGMAPWQRARAALFDRWFEARIEQLYDSSPDDLGLADDAFIRAVHDLAAKMRPFCPPMTGVRAPNGPIVLLAGTRLTAVAKAAAQTRPGDQQERILAFSRDQVEAFEAALIGASQAVFHDVPLSAPVIQAILLAQSYGQPTTFWVGRLDRPAPGAPDLSGLGWTETCPRSRATMQGSLMRSAGGAALCDRVVTSVPALVPTLAKMAPQRKVALAQQPEFPSNGRAASRPVILAHIPTAGAVGTRRRVALAGIEALRSVLDQRRNVVLLVDAAAIPAQLAAFGGRVQLTGPDGDPADPAPLAAVTRIVVDLTGSGDRSAWASAAFYGVPTVRVAGMAAGDGEIVAETPEAVAAAILELLDDPAAAARRGGHAQALLRALLHDEAPGCPAPFATVARPRPRILFANVFFPPQVIGGATRVLRDNIDHFLDHHSDRYDFAILASDDENDRAGSVRCEQYRGIPVFRIATPQEIDMDWRGFNAEVAGFTQRILALFKPDLVHIHCLQRLSVGVAEACRMGGHPYAITLHDAWWIADYPFLLDEDGQVVVPAPSPLEQPYLHRVGVSATVRRAARLRDALAGAVTRLAVSDRFAAIYRQAGFEVETLANGVSPLPKQPRRPGSGPSLNRVRLGHIGGTQAHKGAFLIEAALRTHSFDNLHFTVVELGWDSGEEARTVWGNTPVRRIGKIRSEQVSELYAELDVLIAPSLWPESFGLVTREAAAAGLWLIASDQGAMAEPVVPGRNGFIIDVETIDGLVLALREIDADPARFRSAPVEPSPMRTAADQADELIALYDRLLRT